MKENNEVLSNNVEAPKTKKGFMVTGIVMFALALVFAVITLIYTIGIYTAESGLAAALSFIIFIISVGWALVPAFIFSIIGIIMSALAIKSPNVRIKKTATIFLILNIIILLLSVAILISVIIAPSIISNKE